MYTLISLEVAMHVLYQVKCEGIRSDRHLITAIQSSFSAHCCGNLSAFGTSLLLYLVYCFTRIGIFESFVKGAVFSASGSWQQYK